MKIVCFGDSNTFGYDPRGYFGGRYDHPWPEILSQKMHCTVINQGDNGRIIPKGVVNCPGNADLLIVMLGTNDLLQGASPEEICSRMERFLKSLDRKEILLIALPPMKLGTWVTDQSLIEAAKSLAFCYKILAKRLGVQFADASYWNIPVAYDGVHFTEAGHRDFAEGLATYLDKGE